MNQPQIPTISLIERGNLSLSAAESGRILHDSQFVKLLEGGLLRSEFKPHGGMRIHASNYVGQAILADGSRLTISEKIPNALAGMLQWASPDGVRIVAATSKATDGTLVLEILIRRFLDCISDYLKRGLKKQYVHPTVVLSSPRGRILTKPSAALRSKGIRGQLVCRPSRLSSDLPANRLIALALLCVEATARTTSVNLGLVAQARAYYAFFSQADPARLMAMSWQDRAREFAKEIDSPDRTAELERALSYGRPLALHAASAFGKHLFSENPCAFFINLETLYEDAVLGCAKELLGSSNVSRPSEQLRPHILQGADKYRASPDAAFASKPIAIADCKYKALEHDPDHSDVYQLLVHAETYSAETAVLFYPGAIFAAKKIGRFKEKIDVWCVTLDCALMLQSVRSAISAVGIVV